MNAAARDEAVHRLREESRRRIERYARRARLSQCAMGTMLALMSFAVLETHRQAAPIASRARADAACAQLARREQEIETAMHERLLVAFDRAQTVGTRARAEEQMETARRIAREQGCDVPAPPPPEPPAASGKGSRDRHPDCGGIRHARDHGPRRGS